MSNAPPKIKIYGERNTNTNYLSKLIELNLVAEEVRGTVPRYINLLQRLVPGEEGIRDRYFARTRAQNLGWKHACALSRDELAACERQPAGYVTITKNPYSWLLSLYRKPYHQHYVEKPDFEAFLATPWHLLGRDNLGEGPLASPVELWNKKNASYLALRGPHTVNLTTEATFSDPAAVIAQISDTLGIPKRVESFVNYDRSTKDRGKTPSKDSDYYRNYYLGEKWRAELTAEHIELINQRLDPELVAAIGYTLL